MDENQNLSLKERIQLLLRDRVELEIKKQKIQSLLFKIEEELIDVYLNEDESAFLKNHNLVQYEEKLYLFVFDPNDGVGSLTVTLADSTTYIQV